MLFVSLFSFISWILKNRNFFNSHTIKLPWGHVRPHKECGPDRLSRFDVYQLQTNKQTSRDYNFIYIENRYISCFDNLFSYIVYIDTYCIYRYILYTQFIIKKQTNIKKNLREKCEKCEIFAKRFAQFAANPSWGWDMPTVLSLIHKLGLHSVKNTSD